jgi:RimJ/RimL family protein N-acetyltransferase
MTVTLHAIPTPSASSPSPSLLLRPWRAEDAGIVAAAYRDPLARRWLRVSVTSDAEARQWIEKQINGWATGTRFGFAVEEGTAPGRPVGHIVLKMGDPDTRAAEVGYWTSAAGRGRGIAPLAVETVTQWAFGSPRLGRHTGPLERLELIHDTGNQASCRVAEKSGYGLDSVLPPHPPTFPDEGHLHVRRNPGPAGAPHGQQLGRAE